MKRKASTVPVVFGLSSRQVWEPTGPLAKRAAGVDVFPVTHR